MPCKCSYDNDNNVKAMINATAKVRKFFVYAKINRRFFFFFLYQSCILTEIKTVVKSCNYSAPQNMSQNLDEYMDIKSPQKITF